MSFDFPRGGMMRLSEEGRRKKECDRCGTCCRKGGPALHQEDRRLVREGRLGYGDLVTIRAGELAFNPVSNRLAPASRELVKIGGAGSSWCCRFFRPADSSCAIYQDRPLECRLLACWAPEELLAVVNQDPLQRDDIIKAGDPVRRFIAVHDARCPAGEVEELLVAAAGRRDSGRRTLDRLTELVNQDLVVRDLAAKTLDLSTEVEIFLFGRPIFKQLAALGLSISERNGEILLDWGH